MTATAFPARVAGALHRLGELGVELVRSAVQDFVVAAGHDRRLRTRGLPTGVRVAVLAAVGLAIALFISILAADAWRATDLVPLTGRGTPLRGTLVPAVLVPVTFALLAFAAALCISGVLRAAPLVTAGVVGVYAVVASFVHGLTVGDDLLHAIGGWAIVGVIALAVVVRRLPHHPTVELLVVLGLVGLTFGDAHRLLVAADAASGTGFLPSQTSLILADVLFLSTPLVVVAALGVLDFGVTAARWGLRFVDLHLGTRTVLVGVVALGGRLRGERPHPRHGSRQPAPARGTTARRQHGAHRVVPRRPRGAGPVLRRGRRFRRDDGPDRGRGPPPAHDARRRGLSGAPP
mgnify:CR=1 FL=1